MNCEQLNHIVEKTNNIFEKLETDYDKLINDIQLHESTLMNRVEDDMESLSDRFEAAKRGLSLVNKLSPGMTKLKHTQRVMGNLSNLRTGLLDLEKKIKEMLGK